MQVCIATQSAKNHFNQRMIQECQQSGIAVTTFNPYVSDIPDGQDLFFWRISGVNYDDSDLKKAHKLLNNPLNKKLNKRVLFSNPLETLELCRDKYKLYDSLCSKLPMAHCFKIPSNSFDKSISFINEFESSELVLKTIRGNQGRGVELIQGEKQWQQKLEQMSACNDWRYLVQPRLGGVEYRVFLLKGDLPIVLQRVASGFQANFHQDGSARLVKRIPLKLLDIIEKVNQHIHYHYLAIDVIVGEVAEIIDINAVCGIEQLEKVTQQNMAAKILTKLLSFS
jgi:glutathione synthase/RimK-type ligase-like ATP-grasp enzyme